MMPDDDEINPFDDVNERAVSEWVADTEPVERVWSVIKRVDDAATVDDVARRACVAESDARELLGQMSAIGIVDDENGEYQVPNEVRFALEACKLLDRVDANHIEDRLEDLQSDDADDTTRLNRAIAEVAVALRNAVDVDEDVRSP